MVARDGQIHQRTARGNHPRLLVVGVVADDLVTARGQGFHREGDCRAGRDVVALVFDPVPLDPELVDHWVEVLHHEAYTPAIAVYVGCAQRNDPRRSAPTTCWVATSARNGLPPYAPFAKGLYPAFADPVPSQAPSDRAHRAMRITIREAAGLGRLFALLKNDHLTPQCAGCTRTIHCAMIVVLALAQRASPHGKHWHGWPPHAPAPSRQSGVSGRHAEVPPASSLIFHRGVGNRARGRPARLRH